MTRIDGSQSSSQPLSPREIHGLDLAQVPHDLRPVREEHELPPNVWQRCVTNDRPPLGIEWGRGGIFDWDQFAVYEIPHGWEPVRKSGSSLSIISDGNRVFVNLGTFRGRGGDDRGARDILMCPRE
jgi:hypothetical protein